ncbi:hypothetical protein HAX54_048252 [Datura stramonium]|uniref:Uncharacterized protein n=1 Tax=Datura stramonium TaxID=4076 RepID=A0ABS8WMW3_DATST|nr:hypothetical protein [Datura stramonium]
MLDVPSFHNSGNLIICVDFKPRKAMDANHRAGCHKESGSFALDGFTCPDPIVSRSTGSVSRPELDRFQSWAKSAVVIIADLIAAGDQSGCALFNSAATPARIMAAPPAFFTAPPLTALDE